MEATSRIDVTSSVEDARTESATYADSDPVYAELMATYVEWGTVLNSSVADTAACCDLARRTGALERPLARQFEEAWALWCARNMLPLEGLM